MGIYDRDYYRDQRPGLSLRLPRTMVGILVLVNAAIYFAEVFIGGGENPGHNPVILALSAFVSDLPHPLSWWRFLSYGFAHDTNPGHVIANMFVLWMFGRDVETLYGSRKFLALYLTMIVAGGFVWATVNSLFGNNGVVFGASGAVAGMVVLFALNFPRRTILLFFVVPAPAWVLGVLVVGLDMLGALHQVGPSNVAYTVHLTGAAVGLLYFWSRRRSFAWFEGRSWPRWFHRPGPFLRVHRSEDDAENDVDLSEQVDQILEKIHREGESSLTRKERRLLESASRQYQRRRRPQ